jgi:archaellum component FlaC
VSETRDALMDVATLLRRDWVAQGNSPEDLPPLPPSPLKAPAGLTWVARLAFGAGLVGLTFLVARSPWFESGQRLDEMARSVAEAEKKLGNVETELGNTTSKITSTQIALERTTEDIRKLETERRDTSRQLQKVLASINDVRGDLRSVQEEAKRFKDLASSLAETQRELRKSMAALDRKYDAAAEKLTRIQASLTSVEKEVARLKKRVDKLMPPAPGAPADTDAEEHYSGTREGQISFPDESRDMVTISDIKTKGKYTYPVAKDAMWITMGKISVEPRKVVSGSYARLSVKDGKVTRVQVLKMVKGK